MHGTSGPNTRIICAPFLIALLLALFLVIPKVVSADNLNSDSANISEAQSLLDKGRYADAVRMAKGLSKDLSLRNGKADRQYLHTRFVLGKALMKLGQYKDAREVLAATADTQKKALGAEHPDTLRSLREVALVSGETGNHKDMLRLLENIEAVQKRTLGVSHRETLLTQQYMGLALIELSKAAEARTLLEKVLAAQQKTLGKEHRDTFDSLYYLWVATSWLMEGGDAEMRLAKHLAQLVEKHLGPEHPETLQAQGCVASSLATAGRRDEAIKEYERVIKAETRVLGARHPSTLISTMQLATSTAEIGDIHRAYKLYVQVEEGFKAVYGQQHPYTLMATANRADMDGLLGYTPQSIARNKTIAESEAKLLGKEHHQTLSTMHNLAASYLATEDYTSAAKLLSELVDIQSRKLGRGHLSTLSSLRQLGHVHLELGDYSQATAICKEVLAGRERLLGKEHPDTLKARISLADALYFQRDINSARDVFGNSLQALEKSLPPGSDDFLYARNVFRRIMRTKGGNNSEEVIRTLKEDIAAYATSKDPGSHEIGTLRMELANALSAAKRDGEARELLKKTLVDTLIFSGMDSRIAYWCAAYMASQCLEGNQPRAGIFFWKLACMGLNSHRDKIQGLERELQQISIAGQSMLFHGLIQILVLFQRNEEALAVLQLLKETELDDVTRKNQDVRDNSNNVMTGYEQELYARLLFYSCQSAGAQAAKLELEDKKRRRPLTGDERKRLEESVQAISTMRNNLTDLLTSTPAILDGGGSRLPPLNISSGPCAIQPMKAESNLENLQGMLCTMWPGSILIHALSMDEELYLFITTPTSLSIKKAPVPRPKLNQLVSEYRSVLLSPSSDPRPAAKTLYDALIAPIEKELEKSKAQNIMFSLDGSLRYVPLSALYDGERWLMERYGIALFTEAARDMLRAGQNPEQKVAALGVTKSLAGFSALPAVAEEIKAIVAETPDSAGILPGVLRLDEQFTRQTLAESLKKALPLVHIASHFYFDPATPKNSFLLLGDGSKLSVADMFSDRSLAFDNVDLLTLSACDTGFGLKKGDGREVESFGAMAQRHGARAVLATLWPVADASTADFMRNFYTLRGKYGLNKAAALRQAQCALLRGTAEAKKQAPGNTEGQNNASLQRGTVTLGPALSGAAKDFSHPYYWAPFILMGNWQ